MEWRCAYMHSIDLSTSGPLATLQSLAGCQVLLAGSGCALSTCSEFVALDGWSSLLAHKGTSSSVTKECGLWPYIFCRCLCAGGCMHLFCFLVSFASCVDKPQLISTSCQKSTCANGLLLAGLGEYHLCSSVICLTAMPNVSKSKSNSLWADKTAVKKKKKKKSVVFHLQITFCVHES